MQNNVTGEKRMLYSSLADKIVQYIKDKKLQPGEKLPGERVLASKWGVGRSTIREAIRELEKQGTVCVKVGKGTFVAEHAEGLQFNVYLALKNFLDLFEIKTVLERYCLEKVIPDISEERLDKLERIASEMCEIARDGIMPKEMDHVFHKTLSESYKNREMSGMVCNMIGMYEAFDNELYGYCEKAGIDYLAILLQTFPYHLQMVRQMRAKDIKGALHSYDSIVELDLKIYKGIQ